MEGILGLAAGGVVKKIIGAASRSKPIPGYFRYEGKTYPLSEGVKAFYKTKKNKSGIAYKWTPKHVRGRGFGNPALRESEYAIKQTKEANLIKDKLRELDVEELKGMYGPDLVKYIKDTLNFKRTPRALQLMQQEVVGGGWKKGKGPRGSAGREGKFTYGGKTYLKSEGVQTTTSSGTRWTPKHIRGGKPGNPLGRSNPEQAAEREAIKTELKKIDKETLKGMTGNELRSLANKIPGINRKSANAIYKIREEVIGGGWKASAGKRPLVAGKLARFSGINDLSTENFNKVKNFLSIMQKSSVGKGSYDVLYPIVDRMVKFAKRKGVPEEKIMKKLYDTDIEGISNIVTKKWELRKLHKEAKNLGLDVDVIDLTHIDAISRNWEKALDPSNLIFAEYKSNRYLQKAIEEQIDILRDAIPRAKSLADKKIMATSKVVLDPTKRKEHMYEYYKPRTLEEMKKDLAEANLVSEIGGTRRGAKIDPNDPYFAEKISKDLREKIFSEQWRQAGGMNEGGMVDGYAGGGLIKKGIKKLIDDSAFSASRRKFLKQASATAAATAVPKSILKGASTLAQASKLPLPDAVPWVKTMTNMLKGVVDSKKAIKLPNGTEIFYLKKPLNKYDSHKLSIKTADGSEDLINFKEGKNDFEIEFDIADDFATNQYLEVNKKTGFTEMIDSNLRMAPGGEDVIKDDFITWPIEKTDDIDYKTIADDYMHDYMSIPNDTDYSHLFERYVDSFSPAGNIFKTKQYAQAEKAKRIAEKETREMDWEEQFRGGHGMHGYYRGGTSMRDYPRARNIDLDKMVDAVGMAETSPAYMKSRNLGPRHLYISPTKNYGTYGIGRPTAMDPGVGYEQYGATKWTDFDKTWRNPNKQKSFAKNYLKGMIGYYTANPNKMIYGSDPYYEALLRYGPEDTRETGDYFNKVMSFYDPNFKPTNFNKGGTVENPYTVDDAVKEIRTNPQKFMAGGIVKKLFAPKVMGKLTDYRPKITESPDLARVRTDLYTPPEGPYTITDEGGARVLNKTFKNLDEAQAALKKLAGLRMSDASTFKIFGKRPPKTKEGVSEGAPQVDLGMIGKELPPEKPGAMFWGSREKIINAPYESMTGSQWLRYLKGIDEEEVFKGLDEATVALARANEEGKILIKNFSDMMKMHRVKDKSGKMVSDVNHPDVIAASKALQIQKTKIKQANDNLAKLKLSQREGTGKEFHDKILSLRKAQEQFPPIKDMELNDTGLSPHLSKMGKQTVTKEQLVKDFDNKLAPEIDVVALGGSSEDAGKIYNKIIKYDMQEYRPGPVKNVLQSIRNAGMPLKEAIENNNQEAVSKIIDSIENSVFSNTGVANSIREGFPQKFPYELKKILQDISSVTKTRLAGFDEYAKGPQYKGTQTLSGGENYREFVFKYKHPKGSLRETEPYMSYGDVAKKQGAPEHFTALADRDTMGGFMHMRISDRTDEFGRRILHIEEIQADMHQAMNAAQRALKKKHADWANAGKTPEG